MQTRHRLSLAALAMLLGCGTLLPAAAQGPRAEVRHGTVERAPSTGTRPITSAAGIPYLSGGVGIEERMELDAIANRYNLRMLFAAQGSGKYLASVRVDIRDARGNPVLTLDSEGPWVFAQLPPGNYVVEATAPAEYRQGTPQRQKVRIDASRQSRLNFYWR